MLARKWALAIALALIGSLWAAPVLAAGHGGPRPPSGPGKPLSPVGNDISYPQCGGAFPSGQAFGIVGVNGGLANDLNPCLGPSSGYPQLSQSELYWATTSSGEVASEAKAQLYVNTGDPGNSYQGTAVGDWPTSGSTPYGSCTTTVSGGTMGANSQACAWQYGYDKAQQDTAWLTSAATTIDQRTGTATVPTTPGSYPWWLDVETNNTWQSGSSGQEMNIADLQGMVAQLEGAGVGATSIGIYSDSTQWEQITGVSTPTPAALESLYGVSLWVPGARTEQQAVANCSSTSFTGGAVATTQWFGSTYDDDHGC